jgi:carboxyl-terminal processing protease
MVPQKYAYYRSRQPSWEAACQRAQEQAGHVDSAQQGLSVFEDLMDALYDAHASLGTNSGRSPRLIPSGSDVWLAQAGEVVKVIAVRQNGSAETAGIQVGDVVSAINGLESAIAARRHIHSDFISEGQWAWALNAAAAGYRHEPRSLEVLRGGRKLVFALDEPEPDQNPRPVTGKMLAGDIGYLRFHNSLGNSASVRAFDQELEKLTGASCWIIDLRDSPGGGNTSVAEPVMGRFVDEPAPYQRTVPLDGPAYTRSINPRGPWIAKGPVLVLVGRWTGSMGEGMAIGFDGMKRGRVVGGPMAGLRGGTEQFTLPATGIPVRFPTYDLTHLDGTPRYLWQSEAAPEPDREGDELLAWAIAEVTRDLTRQNPVND